MAKRLGAFIICNLKKSLV
nr:unnamed protein product [Callosobruchus chinensis]CAH7769456.1 unnamed protein product [Callosobruchus chinensis]